MVLDATFAHPQGLPGHMAGIIMARTARLRNEWTLSLLNIQRDDQIIEVGCGPGTFIQRLAEEALAGSIVGIDPSPVGFQQIRLEQKPMKPIASICAIGIK